MNIWAKNISNTTNSIIFYIYFSPSILGIIDFFLLNLITLSHFIRWCQKNFPQWIEKFNTVVMPYVNDFWSWFRETSIHLFHVSAPYRKVFLEKLSFIFLWVSYWLSFHLNITWSFNYSFKKAYSFWWIS